MRLPGVHHVGKLTAESFANRLRQIQEAERLKTALGGPHREHHLGAAADAEAEMKQDSYSNAFVERLFERDQSAIDRELTHAAADLTSVFEQE